MMYKTKPTLLALIVCIAATACQVPATPGPVLLPNTATPQSSAVTRDPVPTASSTPQISTATTGTETLDTPRPTATPITIPRPDIIPGNSIWTYHRNQNSYLVIDVSNGKTFDIPGPPDECFYLNLISDYVICTPGEQLSKYNLYTRQSTLLPVDIKDFPRFWQLNGNALFYMTKDNDSRTGSIYSYGLATGVNMLRIANIELPDADWYAGPFPSANGTRFIFFQIVENQLYKVKESGELMRISPEGYSVAVFIFSWSPNAPMIAYSASLIKDLGEGVDQLPMYIFITNVETGETRQLNPERKLYDEQSGWPAWSRDGKMIAAVDYEGKDICIYSVEEIHEMCVPVPAIAQFKYRTSGLEWSPDGAHIAFVARLLSGEEGLECVMILDLETQAFRKLTCGEALQGLIWR